MTTNENTYDWKHWVCAYVTGGPTYSGWLGNVILLDEARGIVQLREAIEYTSMIVQQTAGRTSRMVLASTIEYVPAAIDEITVRYVALLDLSRLRAEQLGPFAHARKLAAEMARQTTTGAPRIHL